MTDAIETFEHRGLTIKICPDHDPESPREWDNLGTMACWHRRYNLGDEQPGGEPSEYLENLLDSDVLDRLQRRREREEAKCSGLPDKEYWAALRDIGDAHRERVMAEVEKQYIILPLYLYDHSGITMTTSGFHCPWDSGQVGYIHVSLDKVRKEYSVKRVTKAIRARAERVLKAEVKVYATYLEGGYTGYVVEDEDGEHIDSCWGFDDIDYCREEAKSAADYEADRREEAARAEALEAEAEGRAEGVC